MTPIEYKRRLDLLRVSDAPVEVKEKAIKALVKEYGEETKQQARQAYYESLPDTSDMGN